MEEQVLYRASYTLDLDERLKHKMGRLVKATGQIDGIYAAVDSSTKDHNMLTLIPERGQEWDELLMRAVSSAISAASGRQIVLWDELTVTFA